MSQDPNMYNAQYPPQQPGAYGGYPPQQPGGYGGYPPQQPGGYGGFPPQQPGGFPQYPPQAGGGYGQQDAPFQPPPPVPRPDFPKDDDDEQGGGQWGSFTGLEDKAIRRVFIRKVYSILMVQLLVTFGIIALFRFIPEVRNYIRRPDGRWLYYTSYAVFLVTYLVLICSKSAARRFPINLFLLGLLTLSMGYMMGMIAASFTGDSVLIAVGITIFVCLGVTLFSFQTKYDFTNCFGILFVISIALLGFGIVCIFTYSNVLYTVYAGLGAVAFSIFLAVDTQLIMGGKRHEISAEDHILASIMLYIDIVYIFMYILMLLGKRE